MPTGPHENPGQAPFGPLGSGVAGAFLQGVVSADCCYDSGEKKDAKRELVFVNKPVELQKGSLCR